MIKCPGNGNFGEKRFVLATAQVHWPSWWGFRGCRGLKQLLTLCSHSVHTTKARFSFTGHIVRGCSQGSVPSTMGRPSHPHYHNPGNRHKHVRPSPKWCQGPSNRQPTLTSHLPLPVTNGSLVLTFLHFSPRGALLPFPLPLENACLSFSGETRKQPQGTGMSTRSLQEPFEVSLLWQT